MTSRTTGASSVCAVTGRAAVRVNEASKAGMSEAGNRFMQPFRGSIRSGIECTSIGDRAENGKTASAGPAQSRSFLLPLPFALVLDVAARCAMARIRAWPRGRAGPRIGNGAGSRATSKGGVGGLEYPDCPNRPRKEDDES